jgi:hypothetical protein
MKRNNISCLTETEIVRRAIFTDLLNPCILHTSRSGILVWSNGTIFQYAEGGDKLVKQFKCSTKPVAATFCNFSPSHFKYQQKKSLILNSIAILESNISLVIHLGNGETHEIVLLCSITHVYPLPSGILLQCDPTSNIQYNGITSSVLRKSSFSSEQKKFEPFDRSFPNISSSAEMESGIWMMTNPLEKMYELSLDDQSKDARPSQGKGVTHIIEILCTDETITKQVWHSF